MRLIKLAILSFIFLFLLVTIISLFIPSHVRISRATNLAADDSTTFQYISDLPEWRKWHPSIKNVPDSNFTVYKDMSIRVHNTRIAIAERSPGGIVTEISENNGRPIISGFNLIRHQQSDSSTLQWYIDFKLRWYPWEKFRALFYENIYGVQMEQGLHNLKELSEDRSSSK